MAGRSIVREVKPEELARKMQEVEARWSTTLRKGDRNVRRRMMDCRSVLPCAYCVEVATLANSASPAAIAATVAFVAGPKP